MTPRAGLVCFLLALFCAKGGAMQAPVVIRARPFPVSARTCAPCMTGPAETTAAMLSGALLIGAAQSPALPSAAVRIALASLTLLDCRPTADRQLADARAALAAGCCGTCGSHRFFFSFQLELKSSSVLGITLGRGSWPTAALDALVTG